MFTCSPCIYLSPSIRHCIYLSFSEFTCLLLYLPVPLHLPVFHCIYSSFIAFTHLSLHLPVFHHNYLSHCIYRSHCIYLSFNAFTCLDQIGTVFSDTCFTINPLVLCKHSNIRGNTDWIIINIHTLKTCHANIQAVPNTRTHSSVFCHTNTQLLAGIHTSKHHPSY